jgi:chitinase
MFLGGNGAIRPFGTAVVDGVDLDIEGGSTAGYITFIETLRNYFATAPKNYYISSAPQCPYPDGRLGPGVGTALQSAWFDYVWVQFYNNYCGLNYYSSGQFNFNTWGNWAQTISINPNVKVFIGAPAGPNAAGVGYVPLTTLETISNSVLAGPYANVYGGIMLWDTSNSDNNNNFGGSVASYLHAQNIGGSTPTKTTSTTTGVQPPVTPITTGVQSPVTTGVKTSGIQTTGTTGTTGVKTTGTTGLQPTSTSTTGVSSTTDSSCVSGYMKCLTSETYTMCAHSAWGVSQPCPPGLVCAPTGNYIYCIRPT